MRRRDGSHAAGAEVVECLAQLVLRVHHERPVPGDLLADGTAEHEHVERRSATNTLLGRRLGAQRREQALCRALDAVRDRELLQERFIGGA